MSDNKAMVAFAKQSIAVGSLSFALASRLLSRRSREGIVLLYAYCRYADDVIDSLPRTLPASQRLAALDILRNQTVRALSQDPDDHPVFRGLALLAKHYDIPQIYFLDLIAGMEMDIRGYEYQTLDDLELYCYRVAGTVGLMFCHIAGVSSAEAQKHACDLGMAMQMTNISRDVMEDAAMGRCYLPSDWLKEAGIPIGLSAEERMAFSSEDRNKLVPVVNRLLDGADTKYKSGDAGIIYLPLSAAFAASGARYIYHAIGILVRRRGVEAWTRRTYVRFSKKIMLLAKGVFRVLATLPQRARSPFHPVTLEKTWRLPS